MMMAKQNEQHGLHDVSTKVNTGEICSCSLLYACMYALVCMDG